MRSLFTMEPRVSLLVADARATAREIAELRAKVAKLERALAYHRDRMTSKALIHEIDNTAKVAPLPTHQTIIQCHKITIHTA